MATVLNVEIMLCTIGSVGNTWKAYSDIIIIIIIIIIICYHP
jgi:hypothetical protein